MEKDYNSKLNSLAERRESIDLEYRSQKRLIEENDFRLLGKLRMIDESCNNQLIQYDSKLQEIYEERQAVYINMRKQQMDFDEYIDQKYRDEMNILDDEEIEIKAKLAEENNTREGECE